MLKRLSHYIVHSVIEEDQSVWIAQREGRAKNGMDLTSPALLKMITMTKPKGEPFYKLANELKIVPVTISYEYDPCDVRKAKEIFLFSQGRFRKNRHEDMIAVGKGVTEYKGRVVLNIGKQVSTQAESAEQLALELNKAIMQYYHLHPSNILAARMHFQQNQELMDYIADVEVSEAAVATFQERYERVPNYLKETWVSIYANPILNKFQCR